jgi:hypothetical protein
LVAWISKPGVNRPVFTLENRLVGIQKKNLEIFVTIFLKKLEPLRRIVVKINKNNEYRTVKKSEVKMKRNKKTLLIHMNPNLFGLSK